MSRLRVPLRRSARPAALVALIAAACGGHEYKLDATRRPIATAVGDNDPLPVPSDTVTTTDATNGVAVGSVPGSASVDSNGQARYHIPIWVSPGRAGMEPDLALDYESRGQN